MPPAGNDPATLEETLRALHATTSLPAIRSMSEVSDPGMDNQLLLARLVDDRQVLLRQSPRQEPAPYGRASFLIAHAIGAPTLYAANERGATLVEFIPGPTLAAVAQQGPITDEVWRQVGQTYGRIHAVTFPAPLCGPVGPNTIELGPHDPVGALVAKAEGAVPWIERAHPSLLPLVAAISVEAEARAAEIREQLPCLTHGDTNFANMIITDDAARPIDWDFPAIRYPLDELEALEEHAFVNGTPELPDAFFAGYGRPVSRSLLRLYRRAGCLAGMSNPEGEELKNDPSISEENRAMLHLWDAQHLDWLHEQADMVRSDNGD